MTTTRRTFIQLATGIIAAAAAPIKIAIAPVADKVTYYLQPSNNPLSSVAAMLNRRQGKGLAAASDAAVRIGATVKTELLETPHGTLRMKEHRLLDEGNPSERFEDLFDKKLYDEFHRGVVIPRTGRKPTRREHLKSVTGR